MATTNFERVGKALDLLRQGLKPFVEREMQAAYSGQWLKRAGYSLNREDNLPDVWDPASDKRLTVWEVAGEVGSII